MNHRLSSIVTFGTTLAAAVLGAALMTGSARAEGPIGDNSSFTSSRTRAEVKAELMRDRHQVTSAGSEWAMQRGEPLQAANGYTRAQAQAEYIAARDEVRAMTSDDGGSSYIARSTVLKPDTLFAGSTR